MSDQSGEKAFHAVVIGRVQGVGFRAWTHHEAAALRLRGWVRNRPDGTVELWAEGPAAAVDTLHLALHSGPALARVADLRTEWKQPGTETAPFRITH